MSEYTKTVSTEIGQVGYRFLQNMNYKYHYALGEYIDNAIQSYLDNKEKLLNIDPNYVLYINITIKNDYMEIEDNAAGISEDRFKYAFRPAHKFDNSDGMNEFGLGMKTASYFFANKWEVITKALGEDREKNVFFDVNDMIENETIESKVSFTNSDKNKHYTKIRLLELSRNKISISTNQLSSIKVHIASMYRKFIRIKSNIKLPVDKTLRNKWIKSKKKKGLKVSDVQIKINGDLLQQKFHPILDAPFYKDQFGDSRQWKTPINFDFGKGKSVKGFIALLNKMSTNRFNGISLFRNKRVIEGVGDNRIRFDKLSGQQGSPLDKRLFGELELIGFDVSFSKDTIVKDEDFDVMIGLISDEISSPENPLKQQGQNYREKDDPKKIIKKLKEDISKEKTDDLDEEIKKKTVAPPSAESLEEEIKLEAFTVFSKTWKVTLSLQKYPTTDLIPDYEEINSYTNEYKIFINIEHPFVKRYMSEDFKPLKNIALALCISIAEARNQSARKVHYVLRNFNDLLNLGYFNE